MNSQATVQQVLLYLALFALAALGGVILIALEKNVDPLVVVTALVGIIGTAVGGIASMLAQTNATAAAPQPVTVQQPADDPIPVDPA